ncbi:MAG: hypothetical protein HYW33_00140 [Candidatus Blackburnbacteria bacterium]|nr:hypothetical protein [Candidatus Blackburnbacteria bacterium]
MSTDRVAIAAIIAAAALIVILWVRGYARVDAKWVSPQEGGIQVTSPVKLSISTGKRMPWEPAVGRVTFVYGTDFPENFGKSVQLFTACKTDGRSTSGKWECDWTPASDVPSGNVALFAYVFDTSGNQIGTSSVKTVLFRR